MKLSVVIICWNDLKVILDCISSVYAETSAIDYEIIVTDNASSDGSVAAIRQRFPDVRIVENSENGGFGKGNNAGIRVTNGEFVLILNPDTIIRDRALEKLVAYADHHPEAGAFGCRVLNMDGSVQLSAHPLPTLWNSLMKALGLRWPERLWDGFCSDSYVDWDGRSERQIGFQGGCCLLARGQLLKELDGFDERFFHQFEDADLCRRIWDSGRPVLFFPGAEITHIGGQNRGTYSIKVELETERSKYRYFHKYYGIKGVVCIRYISILGLGLRYASCRSLSGLKGDEALKNKMGKYEVVLKWHLGLDPIRFIQTGAEPDVGCARLTPPAKAVQKVSGGR
jgi:N-acetylglucosaminyl-diphospho-decaprenol L-rhamnosyltransferase